MEASMLYRAGMVLLVVLAGTVAWYAAVMLTQSGRHPTSFVSPSTPVLKVEGGYVAEVNHDPRRGALEHTFYVQNISTSTVVIERISPSCSCMLMDGGTGELDPGQSRSFRLRMATFPIDVAEVRQEVNLILAGRSESLTLTLVVKLPLPEVPLYRPDAVYFSPLPDEMRVTRTVNIRVPKHCGVELTSEHIQRVSCKDLEVTLSQHSPTELFREYVVTLIADAKRMTFKSGSVRIHTGCKIIEVPVYYINH